MKAINLSEEQKGKIFELFAKKFIEELKKVEFNVNETKISFTADLSTEAKDKVKIVYTPKAYLRMLQLVQDYPTEIGWYGLVDRIDETTFKVYDVKVCKQYVDGAKVDTEDEDTLEFFNSLTDEEAEHMHFQAHSHVNMSTNASTIDLQNQTDVIKNMGKTGFYIFQIWNKSLDINSYVYDLDNNVFYDKKDVILDIEDPDFGTVSQYVDSIEDLVLKRTYYSGHQKNYGQQNYGQQNLLYGKTKGKRGKKEVEEYESVYPYYGYPPQYWDY